MKTILMVAIMGVQFFAGYAACFMSGQENYPTWLSVFVLLLSGMVTGFLFILRDRA